MADVALMAIKSAKKTELADLFESMIDPSAVSPLRFQKHVQCLADVLQISIVLNIRLEQSHSKIRPQSIKGKSRFELKLIWENKPEVMIFFPDINKNRVNAQPLHDLNTSLQSPKAMAIGSPKANIADHLLLQNPQ